MKKLMFVAAAGLCATVFGAGEVTSANIVGYAKNDLAEGNKGLAPQFMTISGEGFSINDIVFNAASMYDVSLQTLTPAGLMDTMWTWNDWTIQDPQTEEFIGFWDDGSGAISSKTLAPGEGLWIGGKAGDTLQTAGQVGSSDVVLNLVEGNCLVANPFPVPLSINDIVFTAASMYDVSLQTLTPAGLMDTMWTWNDWTIQDPQTEEFIGFWDDGSGEISTFELQPGEALWIGAKEGDSLRIPAPEF